MKSEGIGVHNPIGAFRRKADYILTKKENYYGALEALSDAGYQVFPSMRPPVSSQWSRSSEIIVRRKKLKDYKLWIYDNRNRPVREIIKV